MKRILIIDDNADVQSTVAELLRKSQFEPLSASSGKIGIQMAVQEKPDLILLDVNMPDMNGFEVCKKMKSQPATRLIPIIMVTGESGLENSVKGLDTGADDYITKPFQMKDLMARIHARLRRQDSEKKETDEITVGNLRLEPKTISVTVAGEPVKLTQIEFELLRYFLERPNQLVERKTLLGDLWPDAVVTERTVDTHMANLRKKIKNFNCSLETIYGAGYILKTTVV